MMLDKMRDESLHNLLKLLVFKYLHFKKSETSLPNCIY